MRPFHAIFAGLDDHYGSYQLPRKAPEKGEKWSGRAAVVEATVTVDLYNTHLRGEGRGLGIVPVMRDGNVWWAAIDVDEYDGKRGPEFWAEKIEKLGLPIIVCRSKSGGTHLFFFFSSPAPSQKAIELAEKFVKKLGFNLRTEIFPKQAKIVDVGNWINLPYFGETRKAIHQKRNLSLQDFLQLVAAKEISLDSYEHEENQEAQSEEEKLVPPCILALQKKGVQEGGRNNIMFHVGTYFQRRYGEVHDYLNQWNMEYCDPPSSVQEVMQVADSVSRKEYNYKCKEPVIAEVCNASKCSRVTFGIGTEEDAAFSNLPISKITRVLTEPPTWIVEVNGSKVSCTTMQLNNFMAFKMRVQEEICKSIPDRSRRDWDQTVAELMQSAGTIVPPRDVTETGMVETIFYEWVQKKVPNIKFLRDIKTGQPYYDADNDAIVFTGMSILGMVNRLATIKIKPETVWNAIETIGGSKETVEVEGKSTNVWIVPCNGSHWFEIPTLSEDKF